MLLGLRRRGLSSPVWEVEAAGGGVASGWAVGYSGT